MNKMSEENAQRLSAGELLRMTAEVVASYVQINPIPTSELTNIMMSVHASLKELNGPEAPSAQIAEPAVPIRKSITPDYLVCLEDGRKLKMLKRHLRTAYGMTPDDYRAKWNLPSDYPMVAPNYAKQRSAFAKKIGLGRVGK
jgi:predicted transcriptional regulator